MSASPLCAAIAASYRLAGPKEGLRIGHKSARRNGFCRPAVVSSHPFERLDAESGEIWLSENNFLAGAKMLLGIDPKKDYKDKVAEVRLN